MPTPLPDLQPTLTGPRVLIRPVVPGDWEEMYAAGSDPEIWAVHPVRDRWTEAGMRAFFDGALASGAGFAFVDRETARIIGSSRYHGWDSATKEIEIGWTFLARAYWGGSFNAEVKRLMLDHAFTFADMVVFWVGETNWRSQRAMEKIGGVRREGLKMRTLGGRDVAHVVFEMRKRQLRSSG